MATLMRCIQPHWQGNTFVDVGTVLPADHPQAVPEFFTELEFPAPAEPATGPESPDLDALRTEAESAGVKVDKRWGADRLHEEIAAASKA